MIIPSVIPTDSQVRQLIVNLMFTSSHTRLNDRASFEVTCDQQVESCYSCWLSRPEFPLQINSYPNFPIMLCWYRSHTLTENPSSRGDQCNITLLSTNSKQYYMILKILNEDFIHKLFFKFKNTLAAGCLNVYR